MTNLTLVSISESVVKVTILEEEIQHETEAKRYGINRDRIITEFTKLIIEDLQTLIAALRDDIIFLREEMRSKNIIVNGFMSHHERITQKDIKSL